MKFSEDDQFIQFLQTHQPQAPPATGDGEAALMALLETHPQQSPRKSRSMAKVIWLVPTAIAAGVTILWSQYKPSVPTPEFVQEPGSAAFVSNEGMMPMDEELETFLETSWSNAIEPSSYGGVELYGYSEMFVETMP